jgi:hypothetical protein
MASVTGPASVRGLASGAGGGGNLGSLRRRWRRRGRRRRQGRGCARDGQGEDGGNGQERTHRAQWSLLLCGGSLLAALVGASDGRAAAQELPPLGGLSDGVPACCLHPGRTLDDRVAAA